MSIFNLLKPKTKKEATDDVPDEEYQLPELSAKEIVMNDELLRRYENELLIKQYGIKLDKHGEFV